MRAIGRSSGVIVTMAVSAVLLTATAQAASPTAIVDYGASGYRYLEVASGGGSADFAAVDFDDAAFSTGTAPFGDDPVFCPLAPTTKWTRETDLLVRRSIWLPAGTTDLTVYVAIDNDFDLFWNGTNVASIISDGCAVLDSYVVAVPDTLLTAGPNVLAARARDRGVTSYFDLRVTANLPPSCASVGLTTTRLWPPNHTLRTISASGGVDPEGGDLTLSITGVTQDEPLDGLADGHTTPDASVDGLAENQVQLRAERSGLGDGRVYRVQVTATDPDGASCTTAILVGVPHDRRGSQPVDTASVVVDSFGPAPVVTVVTPTVSPPSTDTPSGPQPVATALTAAAPTEPGSATTAPATDPAPTSHEPHPTPAPADSATPADVTRGGHGGPPERVAARHP